MSLGRFRLDGIPPAPRGIPQVEVTFDIDANGILDVTAKDKATGKEQKITITASTNLDKQDIERMVEEAAKNRTADDQRREVIEIKNEGDALAYQAEKLLNDLGEKVPSDQRGNVESKVNDLRDAIQNEDKNRMQRLIADLQADLQAIGQTAHQTVTPDSEIGTDDGDVVEGEFTEA